MADHQVSSLVRRLTDLEVGDSIIERYPKGIMQEALLSIGGAMHFHFDDETRVFTCTHKTAHTEPKP